MHEYLSIHIGEAGSKIGDLVWQLYCLEHNLDTNGYLVGGDKDNNGNIDSFFSSNGANKYTARGIFIDLEPNVTDVIRTSPHQSIYHPQQFISSQEDASNNYARGYYPHDPKILKIITNQIRQQIENCDNFQGIQLFHSFGGGTGSGLTSLLMEILNSELEISSSQLQNFIIIPSGAATSLEIYNTILALYTNMMYGGLTFLFDNDALYSIAQHNLKIDYRVLTMMNKSVTWHQILNQILAHCVSGITSSFRFSSTINPSFDEMYRNIVIGRLHFPVVSYAPFVNSAHAKFESNTLQSVSRACLNVDNRVLKLSQNKQRIANGYFIHSRSENYHYYSHSFRDHEAKLIKQGNIHQNLRTFPNDRLGPTSMTSCLIANSPDIVEVWSKLRTKFDNLYKHKAFLHWYLNEGMELDHFKRARECLQVIETDYQNLGKTEQLFCF